MGDAYLDYFVIKYLLEINFCSAKKLDFVSLDFTIMYTKSEYIYDVK